MHLPLSDLRKTSSTAPPRGASSRAWWTLGAKGSSAVGVWMISLKHCSTQVSQDKATTLSLSLSCKCLDPKLFLLAISIAYPLYMCLNCDSKTDSAYFMNIYCHQEHVSGSNTRTILLWCSCGMNIQSRLSSKLGSWVHVHASHQGVNSPPNSGPLMSILPDMHAR